MPGRGFDRATERHRYEILCIGSSTGGPQALRALLPRFHADFPYPVVIIQHMSEGFTQGFAETLDLVCDLDVAEAKDGEALLAGHVYVATANHHLGLERRADGLHAKFAEGEKVSGHRPSVDYFLDSAAAVCRDKAIAVILTGMGSDGAKGMVQVRKAGGATIGQSQKTCVVYGMPRVADALGGVEFVEDLEKIYDRLSSILGSKA
ncbi:MAG: chemotaxis protein CheB [Spirochaetes bacterium]|nr:chemotaxis protein CheB [Spirochaetota bacterium]